MRSSNPVLSRDDAFTRNGTGLAGEADALEAAYNRPSYAPPAAGARMTLDDVVSKTAMLFAVAATTAAVAWILDLDIPIGIGALFVGLGLGLVNTFKRSISPALVVAYAAVEGVFLGVFSHYLSNLYPGIALQAVLGTASSFAVMLVLYRTGKVRVTPRFTKTLIGLGAGYLVFLLLNLGLSAFGGGFDLWNQDGGSILFPLAVSVFAVGLASFFLILDFDQIEQGIKAGVPERESWRAAFGLMVTLIWLYVEMLRLIAILRGN